MKPYMIAVAGLQLTAALFIWSLALGAEFNWEEAKATFFGPTTDSYQLCWKDDPTVDYVQFRKTRLETNVTDVGAPIPRADWTNGPTTGEKCRTPQKLAKFGHYTYQIRACANATPAPRCSDWTSSTDQTRATVNGEPQGWWIYGYAPALGQPVPIP